MCREQFVLSELPTCSLDEKYKIWCMIFIYVLLWSELIVMSSRFINITSSMYFFHINKMKCSSTDFTNALFSFVINNYFSRQLSGCFIMFFFLFDLIIYFLHYAYLLVFSSTTNITFMILCWVFFIFHVGMKKTSLQTSSFYFPPFNHFFNIA